MTLQVKVIVLRVRVLCGQAKHALYLVRIVLGIGLLLLHLVCMLLLLLLNLLPVLLVLLLGWLITVEAGCVVAGSLDHHLATLRYGDVS